MLDALILAGGKGSRLGPVSEMTSKAFYMFPDGLAIDRIIRGLIKAQMRRIVVAVAHLEDEVSRFVLKHYSGVQISRQTIGARTAADGILAAQDLLTRDFLVVHVDHYFSCDPYADLASNHQPGTVTFLFEELGKFKSFGYGIRCAVDRRTRELDLFGQSIKRKTPKTILVDGCMVLPAQIFEFIQAARAASASKEKVEMIDVFKHIGKHHLAKMRGTGVQGWWANVNSLRVYAECLKEIPAIR